MCGITGFWSQQGTAEPTALVRRMAAQITHRGPDSHGEWADPAQGVALGHRRLSILDLSPAGHQPMVSASGRYVLCYNGEVYNHPALRDQLGDGAGWQGTSDTETILAIIDRHGFPEALQHLNGMFAFALWDSQTAQLHLARDRMGEKPLYYGDTGGGLLFGSELRPLAEHPSWRGRINRDALSLLLRHNYIGAPHSIFQGIQKLRPAHYVTISGGGRTVSDQICYWDLAEVTRQGHASPFEGSPEAATDQLESLLMDSVGMRMVADVPLGAFLSGGFDSSLVVALMQAQSQRPVKTYTIGFDVEKYNEAEHAKAVATHLGTDHTELYLTAQDALDVVPSLPRMWDEPFADSSQIPTYLVSKLARQDLTVSLSGDGGDELFCGYQRYDITDRLCRKIAPLPRPLLLLGSAIMRAAPGHTLEAISARLPGRLRIANLAHRLRSGADLLRYDSPELLYRAYVSRSRAPEGLLHGAVEPSTVLNEPHRWPDLPELRDWMMFADLLSYLPGDILTKVDRASMAVSLETRVPFLDHRVVNFAQSIPLALKQRDGQAKWLLRQVLYRHVPRALMERPKMGFGVPVAQWLRGPLRPWAEALLDHKTMETQGYFENAKIQQIWEGYQTGKNGDWSLLWAVLMFQAWLAENQNHFRVESA